MTRKDLMKEITLQINIKELASIIGVKESIVRKGLEQRVRIIYKKDLKKKLSKEGSFKDNIYNPASAGSVASAMIPHRGGNVKNKSNLYKKYQEGISKKSTLKKGKRRKEKINNLVIEKTKIVVTTNIVSNSKVASIGPATLVGKDLGPRGQDLDQPRVGDGPGQKVNIDRELEFYWNYYNKLFPVSSNAVESLVSDYKRIRGYYLGSEIIWAVTCYSQFLSYHETHAVPLDSRQFLARRNKNGPIDNVAGTTRLVEVAVKKRKKKGRIVSLGEEVAYKERMKADAMKMIADQLDLLTEEEKKEVISSWKIK